MYVYGFTNQRRPSPVMQELGHVELSKSVFMYLHMYVSMCAVFSHQRPSCVMG